jgi:beta-lactamase class A
MVGMLSVLVINLSRSAVTSTADRARAVAARPLVQLRTGATPARFAASNPLVTPAARAFLAQRAGTVSIAMQDLVTGQTWLYHPAAREETASIMKVDILETLLRQSEVTHTPLDDVADRVQGMIENSDNDDAQDLWDLVGGSSAVAQYNAAAGLSQTVPDADGYWGTSTTSAADQIKLLHQLVSAHGLLDRASRSYEVGLMEHVEADQDWGVSAGVPGNVSVALKDGWLPVTSNNDWQVNSIGRIKGDGRDYLIAVLTAHDPSEAYGINTIEGLSKIVYSSLNAR